MTSHQDWPWHRITGILGIVFFIGFAIALFGLALPVQPVPTDPIDEIRDFFADDDAVVHAANWVIAVILLFAFLPFAAGLRSVLAERDVDAGMWSRTVFGAAVGIVAVSGAGSALLASTMLAFEGGELDDAVLRLILFVDAYFFSVLVTVGIAAFLVAASIVVLRTRVLWRWLGWLGLAIAVIGLIGMWWPLDGDPDGALALLGYLPFPLMALWSALVGINLLRPEGASSR